MVLAGCSSVPVASSPTGPSSGSGSSAATVLPPTTQRPAGLPRLKTEVQPPKTLTVLTGVFNDRLTVSNPVLSLDGPPTATVTVRGWEGELITMSTAVGFYDAEGTLLETVPVAYAPLEGKSDNHYDVRAVATTTLPVSFAVFSVVDFVTE
jgi:hypothetical protein